jgi:hypothetical protein
MLTEAEVNDLQDQLESLRGISGAYSETNTFYENQIELLSMKHEEKELELEESLINKEETILGLK